MEVTVAVLRLAKRKIPADILASPFVLIISVAVVVEEFLDALKSFGAGGSGEVGINEGRIDGRRKNG